jgi:Pregnancy-associated plasma protein-A
MLLRGITTFAAIAALSVCAKAQENKQHLNCAHDHYLNHALDKNPEARQRFEKAEEQLALIVNGNSAVVDKKTRATIYKIPLVIHVIHRYGIEDITDAQVFDAVKILNNDFNKRNADTSAVVSAFATKVANAEIEFVLARKAPDGSCTNGIDRIYSYKTNNANDESKLNGWDPSQYFNVWVVADFDRAGVAGYSYSPNTISSGAVSTRYDGVIILNDYIGSIGTGSVSSSRALTHECGHSFALPHPWGSTNSAGVSCGDDNITDTPPTKGFTSCQLNIDACNAGVIENAQNFMDYSYCSMMFTPGQKTKMRSVISNNIAQRGTLGGSNSATVSGINNPPADCPIKADFGVSRFFACAGILPNVSVRQLSFGDTLSTVAWNIADGVYSANGNGNVSVNFPTPGWKDLSLTATANTGSSTKSKPQLVYVNDPAKTYSTQYIQDFENTSINAEWPMFNIFENECKFTLEPNGINGGNCLKLSTLDQRTDPSVKYINTLQGDIDEVITPAFNFNSQSGVNLGFFTSAAINANSTADATDLLTVQYSTNCGTSWLNLKTYSSTDLLNKSFKSGVYAPTAASDWVARTIPLTNTITGAGRVFFRFQYTASSAGNNFYIDNISLSTWPTALTNAGSMQTILSVLPTSASAGQFVSIQTNNSKADIIITDIGGKVIQRVAAKEVQVNSGNILLNTNVRAGMYFVSAEENNVRLATQKLVVQ